MKSCFRIEMESCVIYAAAAMSAPDLLERLKASDPAWDRNEVVEINPSMLFPKAAHDQLAAADENEIIYWSFRKNSMTETETKHLIEQAARELQLENVRVEPSVDRPGYYDVKFMRDRMRTEEERQLLAQFYETATATIPMGAEFKNIINTLKASVAG